jgi:hypothetical protein
VQKYLHDLKAWNALSVETRTRGGDFELRIGQKLCQQ